MDNYAVLVLITAIFGVAGVFRLTRSDWVGSAILIGAAVLVYVTNFFGVLA